jgi:hypothetical protein
LEMRFGGNPIEGSNPSLSATLLSKNYAGLRLPQPAGSISQNSSRQGIVQVCACRSGSRIGRTECLMTAKQIVSAVLALLLAVSFAAPNGARALTDYGFTYTQTGGAVTVTGCNGACPTTLDIPAVLGGYFVTRIGDDAFAGESLTAVTISSTVTTIGVAAFASNNLTAVTIGNSVTDIGAGAFASNDLTTVSIPNSVTSIGYNAFGTNLLTTVTIGNSVTTLDGAAFASNRLTTMTIPNSVTHIGEGAFYNNLLTSVTFLGNAPTEGASVFYLNSGLTSVTRSYTATGWGSTWNGVPVVVADVQAVATVKPTVTGTSTVGKTLTAAKGTWAGYPTPTFTYQWYACTTAVSAARTTVPSTCKKITGATRSTFKLTSAQRGKYVAVLVKGTSLRTTATTWLSKTTAKVR